MGQPLALNPGANQYTGPSCGTKKCFIAAAVAGDITTIVNKGRWVGPMSSLLLLDVYGWDKSSLSFLFIFVMSGSLVPLFILCGQTMKLKPISCLLN